MEEAEFQKLMEIRTLQHCNKSTPEWPILCYADFTLTKKLFIHLLERWSDRVEEIGKRDREIFHFLAYFPNAHNNWD